MSEDLVRTIVGFPKYIWGWTLGLIVAILSDLHITTLAVTGVFAGIYGESVILGILVFFVTYSISRVLALTSNAVSYAGQSIASSLASNNER